MQDGERIIQSETELREHITSYYKFLFGPPKDSIVQLDWTHQEDIPQVTYLENQVLTEEFSEEEVKNAIWQMTHNRALGPDEFLAEFYSIFWEVLKRFNGDVMTFTKVNYDLLASILE